MILQLLLRRIAINQIANLETFKGFQAHFCRDAVSSKKAHGDFFQQVSTKPVIAVLGLTNVKFGLTFPKGSREELVDSTPSDAVNDFVINRREPQLLYIVVVGDPNCLHVAPSLSDCNNRIDLAQSSANQSLRSIFPIINRKPTRLA